MKRILSTFIIGAALLLSGCGNGKESKSIDITGTWELVNIEITKSAQLGEETIEVEITFNADNTFSFSQILGEGRAQEFTGTWALAGTTLSGKYSNGKAWGSTYEISVEESTLTMVPESGAEAYIYRKTN